MISVNFNIKCRVVDNPLNAISLVKDRVKIIKEDEEFKFQMFKLIICDMQMPQMQGEECIKQIKQILTQNNVPLPYTMCSSSLYDFSQYN